MKTKKKFISPLITAALVIGGIAGLMNSSDLKAQSRSQGIVYYGDYDNDQVFAVDIGGMKLLATIPTEAGPYPVDKVTEDLTYVITRKANSVDVIDNKTLLNLGVIPLPHKPRSSAYNAANGLVLIAGADKAMTTIIRAKTGEILGSVGVDQLVTPTDYGGSLASGHPFWVNKRKFMLLDRTNRKIFLYSKRGRLLSAVKTPTSVHHIIHQDRSRLRGRDRRTFYAVGEGSQLDSISPNIVRLEVRGRRLVKTGVVYLNSIDPLKYDASIMGAHHADLHPNGKHIYMGSTEGFTFVVNRKRMRVEKVIETGKGAGHTTFAKAKNLALVTNHNDSFVTIIDTRTHRKIKDLEIMPAPPAGRKSQGHTASISPDGRYYYASASNAGFFYELDLETLEITRTLETGGYPLQGVFLWE